ncbi:MAG TPA: glycosyltransferase family protein [bacterium]|nr:glycosyltransferase family protein [bacterium]
MIIAIIQARVLSTRLPRKVLMSLCGKTVLEHVVSRIQESRFIDTVVVATTTRPEDDAIVDLCQRAGMAMSRGSEDDVLDRYYRTAQPYRPDHVVRVTSDCPLIDSEIVDQVIEAHLSSGADYTSNTLQETYPDGLDVEVFTFSSLEKAWKEASLKSEREHVTPYIKKNQQMFKLNSVVNKTDLSQKRWTLDQPEDWILIKAVYDHLYEKNTKFCLADILHYLSQNPEVEQCNQIIRRNEGYEKSLQNDFVVTK